MKYLLCRCRNYALLIPADRVEEVAPATGATASGYREWRDQGLPVVDLSALLGVPPGEPRHHIVCRNTGGADAILTVLEVDRAEELREHEETDFLAFPSVTSFVAQCFDGAVPEPGTGHCLYRLRLPLPSPPAA